MRNQTSMRPLKTGWGFRPSKGLHPRALAVFQELGRKGHELSVCNPRAKSRTVPGCSSADIGLVRARHEIGLSRPERDDLSRPDRSSQLCFIKKLYHEAVSIDILNRCLYRPAQVLLDWLAKLARGTCIVSNILPERSGRKRGCRNGGIRSASVCPADCVSRKAIAIATRSSQCLVLKRG